MIMNTLPPSKSYPDDFVWLFGKLIWDASDHNGIIYKISEMWSSGLDLIKALHLQSIRLYHRKYQAFLTQNIGMKRHIYPQKRRIK